MRGVLRSPWFRALLILTAAVAVLVIPLLPEAMTPLPPCNYHEATNPDPALPTCPPDNANYGAIGVALLILLWLVAASVGLIAFALTRFLRTRYRPRRSPPDTRPGSGS
jgi:hypothetical protein